MFFLVRNDKKIARNLSTRHKDFDETPPGPRASGYWLGNGVSETYGCAQGLSDHFPDLCCQHK